MSLEGLSEGSSAKNLEYTPHHLDNPKVEVQRLDGIGRAVFAQQDIHPGELIALFHGPVYEAESCLALPNDEPERIADHVIQVGERQFRHGRHGLAELINHSCDPNCGINGENMVVSRRLIKAGEQITWDYAMTEDSDWSLDGCQCGADRCRGVIGPYRDLPDEIRQEYAALTAYWLKQKYDPRDSALPTEAHLESSERDFGDGLRVRLFPDMTELADDVDLLKKVARFEMIIWGLPPFNEYAYCIDPECGRVQSLFDAYPQFEELRGNYPLLRERYHDLVDEVNSRDVVVPECLDCCGPTRLICGPDTFVDKLDAFFRKQVFGLLVFDEMGAIHGMANALLTTRIAVFDDIVNYRGGYDREEYLRRMSELLGGTGESDGHEPIVYWNKIALSPHMRGGKKDYFGRMRRALLDVKPEFDELALTGDTRFDTKVYSMFEALGYEDVVFDEFGHVVHVHPSYRGMREVAHLGPEAFQEQFAERIRAARIRQRDELEPRLKAIKAYQRSFDFDKCM